MLVVFDIDGLPLPKTIRKPIMHILRGYHMQGDWVQDARATLAELKGQDNGWTNRGYSNE